MVSAFIPMRENVGAGSDEASVRSCPYTFLFTPPMPFELPYETVELATLSFTVADFAPLWTSTSTTAAVSPDAARTL